jgi:hypothetical protein
MLIYSLLLDEKRLKQRSGIFNAGLNLTGFFIKGFYGVILKILFSSAL